ncbi:hypothetical protein [Rufibacter roseus]|uniref:Uncharacterized protein n=1 Tax=Rufibacter roseus TaxID=1567108 RepID=A0ABW2DK46_9BACT|nr:hypothetical protein [Rufibacter roseus]
MKTSSAVSLWIYFRSASPVYTQTLPAHDERLTQVLDDVRMVRHGSHIFIHLRSEYEWERAMYFLGEPTELATEDSSAA